MRKYITFLASFIWAGLTTVFAQTLSGNLNGHEYIDLGLPSGTKWATMNVGADSSNVCGGYFAWGEVSTKAEYGKDIQTQNKDASALNAFNIINENGTLTEYYDAATINWGEGWRMPKKEDFDELIENCVWEWDKKNVGYIVKGKNGNSIFLPAAGNYFGDSKKEPGYGRYWCSSVDETNSLRSWCLCFHSISKYMSNGSFGRYYGRPVRPVTNADSSFIVTK